MASANAVVADDLFAGAGGWDVAAAALGVLARGVENDPAARATRDAAGLVTVHDDAWTYEPDGLAQGLIASPPCQTFSKAGKGSGRKALVDVAQALATDAYGDRDELRALARAVGDERTALVLLPMHYATRHDYRWLAWEQVPTVLPVWEACAAILRELGWRVWVGLVHAEQHGVPQTRTRAVLLGVQDGEAMPPPPTHSRYYPRDPTRLDEGVAPWVTMAQGLPRLAPDLPAWCHHRPATTVVGSYRPDVVASPGYRTTVSRQNAPGSVRVTVAQAGVLQGFSADYPWQGGPKGGTGPAYRQVGNAIPPPLAAAVLAQATGSSSRTDTDSTTDQEGAA